MAMEITFWMLADPVVARHYSRNHDFGIVPFDLSDLGARIVAHALAVELGYHAARCERHGFSVLAARAYAACDELSSLAAGEDAATDEYTRERWALLAQATGG